MATIDVRQLFNTYAATFATRDADAIVALHPPDTQFWLRDGGQPVQGRAAVRDTVTGALTGPP
ncbi:nuclear transport factor 2 family protein [Actinophytocola sp.]|uniref:nuclear transport factor 2 family protein n=1 Tax=Actinophytocola sp. TaxID=1872138 RepID=UPI002ED35882